MIRNVKKHFVLLPLLVMLSGCGIIDYFWLPVPEDTAQELYEAGADAMKEKDYYNAAQYFSSLIDRYPFSPYTPQAELSLADAYFLDGDYLEAMEAYKDFEAMHPRNEQMPYVLYQVGVSAEKSFVGIDRPQDQVAEGVQYLNRLRESYPETPYAQEAVEVILRCRKLMAEREIYVADFYWNDGRYGSAWKRYQYVVTNFKDLPEVFEYASRKAELSYLKYQQDESGKVRDEVEGSWTDWFEWM